MSDRSEAPRRRQFLGWLGLTVAGLSGAAVAAPVVGFVLGPVLRRRRGAWRPVGHVDRFKVGETVLVSFRDTNARPWAGRTAKTGAWLRRVGETDFLAISLDCTHLGCPVRWDPGARLFMCPCHGGVYYWDGKVAAGPPPQPLHRYPVRLRDGQVEIEAVALPIT